jgi:hypothetical protein
VGDTTLKRRKQKEGNDMEFLKNLFQNKAMTFDELVQAINAHNGNEANKENQIKIGNLGGGEYVGKGKYDALNELLTGKQTELDTAHNLIKELKNGTKGNEELQGKITGFETQVAQLQAQLQETKIKSAVKVALLSEKAKNVGYLTYLIEEQMKADGKKLELDENENIKGWDNILSGLKTKEPDMFESGSGARKVLEGGRLPKGDDGNVTVTKEQFYKMGYNDRLKLKQDNPELFKQLATM